MEFIEELRWRGMLQEHTPGLAKLLAEGKQKAYIGFDPTASSMHIGNLATIHLLIHFARAGHTPVALVGGATGLIGDPSGKSEERSLLSEETLAANAKAIHAQLQKICAAYGIEGSAIEMANNMDWYGPMSVVDFLRTVGKTLTVNYMMAKDSVKSRMETGISFTEFSYQLLQGYDFYMLNKTIGCRIQMGGADQWGNITAGAEIIRRLGQPEGEALTTPLVTKADGSKFGKSESGNVWLDASLTSPYKFYQFWLNVADADAPRLLRVFTFLSKAEIERLEEEHAPAPHQRILQKALAGEVTRAIHGLEALEHAKATATLLFGGGSWADWQALSEQALLDVLEGVPTYTISTHLGVDMPTLLSAGTDNALLPSKGEARKLIAGGGLSLNLQKLAGTESVADFTPLHGKYLLGTRGKKNFFLLKLA